MLYWGTKQEWGKRGGQAGRPGEHLQGGALWSWQLAPYRIQEYSTGLIRKHLQRNHMEPLHLKTIHWEKEKEAIFLWVPSCVLSLISQNPSHGIVIPYDLHAGCITGHFGKSSGKLGPPGSSQVRPDAGAALAPMEVDVIEPVLMPGPEPRGEAEVARAGRYGGRNYDHWK